MNTNMPFFQFDAQNILKLSKESIIAPQNNYMHTTNTNKLVSSKRLCSFLADKHKYSNKKIKY